MAAQLNQNDKGDIMPSNKLIIYKGGKVSRNRRKEVESANIHTDVTAIEQNAFWNCSKLKTVSFADTSSITSIGAEAFYGCRSLQHIKLPESITAIERCAFEDCSNLQSVILPSSISVIPDSAFNGCESLTEVNIPNSIKTIEKSAFNNCTSLQSVSIPSSVTTIQEWAFAYCSSLQDVDIPSSTTIERLAFLKCPNLNFEALQHISNCFTKDLTLHSHFQQGPGPKRKFKGLTQKGWGPEYCGMSLQQIKNILDHPCINDKTTMRDVVRLVIKPATKQKGVSYALLVNQDAPLHADIMVSVSSTTISITMFISKLIAISI